MSEILRDHRELGEDEKKYLLDALLDESARLWHSIDEVLEAVCDEDAFEGQGASTHETAGCGTDADDAETV